VLERELASRIIWQMTKSLGMANLTVVIAGDTIRSGAST